MSVSMWDLQMFFSGREKHSLSIVIIDEERRTLRLCCRAQLAVDQLVRCSTVATASCSRVGVRR